MPDSPLYYQSDDYLKTIEILDGIKFTPREIDILACILSGKSIGVIASILGISARTIEGHSNNIRTKLNCNSRNGIIEFLEKSDKLPILKNHYQYLLTEQAFREALKKVFKATSKKLSIKILHNKAQEDLTPFIHNIKHVFHLAGIKIASEARDKNELSLLPIHINFQNTDFIIRILNKEDLEKFQSKVSEDNLQPATIEVSRPIIFLLWNTTLQYETIHGIKCINFNYTESFYLSFLKLLQNLLPDINLKEFTDEFHKSYGAIQRPIEVKTSDASMEGKQNVISYKELASPFLAKYKHKVIYCVVLFFIAVTAWLLISKAEDKNYTQASQSVRADLVIPTDSVMLKRSELIDQIERKLNTQKGVQTIALVGIVGMGGVGKTTLARHFGKLQESSLVWEINAETNESLINSFKDLAYALAKTKSEKEELEFVKAIQNPQEKEKQLLYFVKNRLKQHPNWLLIYDNVNTLADIKNYLPQDHKVWGNGKVIITTRDSNIKNNSLISSDCVIRLGELSQNEALTLFSKILYNIEPNKLPPNQKEKALGFLKNIPSFPLDVSVAAYYIKDTHISYEQYLERINQYRKDIEATQANLFKEVSAYEKTRYEIISLSFKKIIELNPEFKELLLFVCLLDSQNIPINLLETYKNPATVDNFLHVLRQYSLTTSETSINDKNQIHAFSLHRSTQALGKDYILGLLNQKDKKEFLDSIIKIFHKSYEQSKLKHDTNIIMIIPHLEAFRSNLSSIDIPVNSQKNYEKEILYILGYVHHVFTHNLINSKKYFSKFYKLQSSDKDFNNKKLATLLLDLGNTCANSGDVDESLFYCQESMKLFKKIPHSNIEIALIFEVIGYNYSQQNNFDKAKNSLEQALNSIRNIDNSNTKELEAELYFAMGSFYYNKYLNKVETLDAEKYILKALKLLNASELIHKNTSKKYDKLSCMAVHGRFLLGEVYTRLGKYDDAIEKGFQEAEYLMKVLNENCNSQLKRAVILRGMGEVLLRKGKITAAQKKLTESIYIHRRLGGELSTLRPLALRAEAMVRLEKFKEAYMDCSSIFKLDKNKKGRKDNYSTLNYLTCFYHAAFIKYKQNDFKKSFEHFGDFFKAMQEFCKGFLDEKDYKALETKDAFTINLYNTNHAKEDIKKYLKNSVDIFTAIYGKDHPFVKDYIILNYEEAIKPWWNLF